MRMNKSNREHAVVIGGSMGGLLAARVLAEHFERVTIVERDRMPAGVDHRRGVPQSRHTHGILGSGANILEELFPGIRRELIDAGAVSGDIVQKGRWFHEGGYLKQTPSGMIGLVLSRPLLETTVRKRVLALDRIRLLEECDAEGLAASDDGKCVTGLKLKGGSVINADLVVNAAGRASHGPAWLESLGYPKPQVDRVEVALGYTTRLFRRCPNELNGDIAVIIPPTPSGKKGGVMIAQEGDRWTVTLIAHFGGYAPSGLEGFRAFARNLHAPDIDEVVRAAEPIGDAQTARFPASVRQRYERLTRFPTGYLAFGDAICSFNPIYGQGMSAAALQAMTLRKCLRNEPRNLAKTFFTEVAAVIDIPWSIAVGNDLRMPEKVGPRTTAGRFTTWYVSKVHKAAHHDSEVSLAFHKVASLLEPPSSLMKPRLAWRVFKGRKANQPEAASAARTAAASASHSMR
jgi:2-polyprenyl-6-methoxyphenol hydroxylase-like FAD-dependent oxidoreductase